MVGQLLIAAKPLLDQIKLFLALSRTPHGLFRLGHPGAGRNYSLSGALCHLSAPRLWAL